jgi:hypothetical protein
MRDVQDKRVCLRRKKKVMCVMWRERELLFRCRLHAQSDADLGFLMHDEMMNKTLLSTIPIQFIA